MSRTTQRSIKLYETLTNKQKAAVFIELAATQDSDEADRLLSQVERRTYSAPHVAYTSWCDSFTSVCAIIGLEFWRQCFLHSQALLVMSENEKLENIAPEAAMLALGKQLALQAVLKELCHQHGFDYEAACKLATIPAEPTSEALELADRDYYSKMLADLEECLPAA